MGRKLEKYPKIISNILCWDDIEEAVLTVQGPYLNIEQSNKMAKTSEINKEKMQIILVVTTMLKELCSELRVHIQI